MGIAKMPLIGAMLLALGACSTNAPQQPEPSALASDKGYTLGEEVKEIYNYRVSGWVHINNRALIIAAGPGDNYLLTLSAPCISLDSTEVIAFTTTGSRVLSRFDSVLVKERRKQPAERCPISHMYKLTKAEKK